MNKILLFILLCFTFLLFIPNSRADLNFSTVINYDFNDQEIEIVITNDDDGEINLIITSYAIHNLNSGHFLDFPGAMLFIPEFPPSIIIEPQGSFTLINDFPANRSDVIEVRFVFSSGGLLISEVIAGYKEEQIFNITVISIFSSIVVITTCIVLVVVVAYFKKIKPNRKITKFQIRIDEIKSNINEMNYNDARSELFDLQREYNDDEINSSNLVIDELIIQCNYNISFMERKQHFINIFKQGESKNAYQGLVELQKQYNSPDYHGLIDPAVFNQIVETLKEFSENI